MNETLERLLWQLKDGELSVEDRKQLDGLVAEGDVAAEAERELESMARLLSRARFEEEEVPSSLRSRVMEVVQARAAVAGRRRQQVVGVAKSKRGTLATGLSALDALWKESFMSRKRLVLLGAAAVIVIAGAAFLLMSDNFPPGSKLTGTIGGVQKAERYRDAQVTASDVKVYGEDGYDQDGYDRNGLDRNGKPRPDAGVGPGLLSTRSWAGRADPRGISQSRRSPGVRLRRRPRRHARRHRLDPLQRLRLQAARVRG